MTKIKVEYIDHMGTDLSVVNAARVSHAKESEWECSNNWPFERELGPKDLNLIQYLNDHAHWTPFAHTAISVRVTAPIFLARQLFKHTVGVVANEVSRRYVDSEPEFYLPETLRKRAPNVKQGSLQEPVGPVEIWDPMIGPTGNVWEDPCQLIDYHNERSLWLYNSFIKAGVAPEQARMILPQSMMTEWIWTGNLASFARIYALRADSHAQLEAQEFAKALSDVISPLFPDSWEILTEGVNQ